MQHSNPPVNISVQPAPVLYQQPQTSHVPKEIDSKLQEQLAKAEAEVQRLKQKLEMISKIAKTELSLTLAPSGVVGNSLAKTAESINQMFNKTDILILQKSEQRLKNALNRILEEVDRKEENVYIKKKDLNLKDIAREHKKRPKGRERSRSFGGKGIMDQSKTSSTDSSSSGSPSSTPLPPRRTLTPEERTELLQKEFVDTEVAYVNALQKTHDVSASA